MRHNNRQQYMHCVCKLCGIQSQQAHSLKIVKKVRDSKKSAPFRRLIKVTVVENHRKVAFNIASEASYILSEQKLTKNVKNGQFWRVFGNATFLVIFKHCARTLS